MIWVPLALGPGYNVPLYPPLIGTDHNLFKDLIEKEIKARKIKYDEEFQELKAELKELKVSRKLQVEITNKRSIL